MLGRGSAFGPSHEHFGPRLDAPAVAQAPPFAAPVDASSVWRRRDAGCSAEVDRYGDNAIACPRTGLQARRWFVICGRAGLDPRRA